jgi:hypothetical protein
MIVSNKIYYSKVVSIASQIYIPIMYKVNVILNNMKQAMILLDRRYMYRI